MVTLRIAWRNLLRKPRRTAITLAAVALTTGVLIGTLALMQGMIEQMERSATRLVVGDAQVHAPGWRVERSMYKAIDNPDEVLRAAKEHGLLAAPRSYGYGLISSGPKSAGASFMAVDPATERAAFELAQELRDGEFLADTPSRKVVIGRKLAKSLHAEVGSELVAVVQAADGSLGNELFTVAGILKGVGEETDRGGVVIHRADFDELFVAGGRVHEISINGQGRSPEQVVAALGPAAGKAEIRTWRELLPGVSDMLKMSDAGIYLFGMIFVLAAGLGVLNTMLMATHDRIREFGVLKALGATPLRIIKDVAVEGYVLALVATAIGTVLGLAMSWYFQVYGIDLSAFGDAEFGFAGIAWDPLWRAHLLPGHVVNSLLLMWVTCVVASLYPAVKAARLDPAQAMVHV